MKILTFLCFLFENKEIIIMVLANANLTIPFTAGEKKVTKISHLIVKFFQPFKGLITRLLNQNKSIKNFARKSASLGKVIVN